MASRRKILTAGLGVIAATNIAAQPPNEIQQLKATISLLMDAIEALTRRVAALEKKAGRNG